MHVHVINIHVQSGYYTIGIITKTIFADVKYVCVKHFLCCYHFYKQRWQLYTCTSMYTILSKIVTAPWDYVLHKMCDDKAHCSAHHVPCYHGWHSSSSCFLDLWVRIIKTSATRNCQA